MDTWFALAATAVVVAHLAFAGFAVAGSLLAFRWRWIPGIHVPCALWAAYIELSGRICPLTPLEHDLRSRAGLAPYSGDFVAHYIFPLLYPEGLTRDAQITLGAGVVVVNAVAYIWLWRRRRPHSLPRRRADEIHRRTPSAGTL